MAFSAALVGVALLCTLDAVMKSLVLGIGIYALSIWRAVTNLAVAAPLYFSKSRSRPAGLWMHVVRGALTVVMMPLFVWGIARVTLAEAIVLTFIAPVIASLLAAFLLHERVHRTSIIGSAVATCGVLVVACGEVRTPTALLGDAAILGSSACYAGSLVLMRLQGRVSTPAEISFFQSVTAAVIWLMFVPTAGLPPWPRGWWFVIFLSSVLTTVIAMVYAWAYARAKASYLVATEYSGFIWSSLLGWTVFNEHIRLPTVIGAVVIICGCAISSRASVSEA